MSEYQFLLKLEGVDPRSTQVRVWIDDQLSGDLSSEQEITLEREAGAWSARFAANGNAFIYRIGIFAAHGVRWSLCFRNVDEDEELLFDSDELAMPKEWLVGTCEDAFRTPRLLGHSSEVHIR